MPVGPLWANSSDVCSHANTKEISNGFLIGKLFQAMNKPYYFGYGKKD